MIADFLIEIDSKVCSAVDIHKNTHHVQFKSVTIMWEHESLANICGGMNSNFQHCGVDFMNINPGEAMYVGCGPKNKSFHVLWVQSNGNCTYFEKWLDNGAEWSII